MKAVVIFFDARPNIQIGGIITGLTAVFIRYYIKQLAELCSAKIVFNFATIEVHFVSFEAIMHVCVNIIVILKPRHCFSKESFV